MKPLTETIDTAVDADEESSSLDALVRMVDQSQDSSLHDKPLDGRVDDSPERIQRRMRQLQDELQHHRMTAELLKRELNQKEQHLEDLRQRSSRLLAQQRDFVAQVSHEIRTPMNAMIGMISLLMESSLDGEQLDCAQTMRGACDSMLIPTHQTARPFQTRRGRKKRN